MPPDVFLLIDQFLFPVDTADEPGPPHDEVVAHFQGRLARFLGRRALLYVLSQGVGSEDALRQRIENRLGDLHRLDRLASSFEDCVGVL